MRIKVKTMELSEVLLKRRSIRKFEEKAVSDDVIEKLVLRSDSRLFDFLTPFFFWWKLFVVGIERHRKNLNYNKKYVIIYLPK